MVSPRLWGVCGGTTDIAPRVGRNALLGLVAPDHGLELVEVREVAVDGCELDRADGVHAREAALGEVAHLLGRGLPAEAPDLGHYRVGDRVELLLGDRSLAGRPAEAAQELLAVEALARAA